MKTSAALAVWSVVTLLAVAAPPAFSEENERTTISEYCASHSDFGLSHGGCVAYFETHNVAPHDASVCRNDGIQKLLGVANHGQCVKKLAAMRK